jgi:hypothetical protein
MTDNKNGSVEDTDKRFQDGKQRKATVYLELSDKLKNKATVESISIYRRAIIVVALNHGCKRTIISSISPIWTKTISEFEKQAKRKNLSEEETIDITDFLDDNHKKILEILDADSRYDIVDDNDLNRTKERQEILTEIEKSRTDNKNMTLDEWQEKLVGKYDHLQDTVNRNFPSLWPALEFELSILKILNIKDCTLPFAGTILGVPSSLKTQCIELLRSWPNTFYTDNFSAKSFVSHTTAVPKEMLAEIDLLPKIKNKCFLTPELAPTFAAKDDDLIQILGIMTRILDGNGYESDSGAQGHRGYSGKMMFTWVGAAVDIPHKVHKLLGTLGPKLYFLRLPVQGKTEEGYLDQIKNDNFNTRVGEAKEALFDYLKWFEIIPDTAIDNKTSLLKVPWNSEKNDKLAQRYIVRLARLLAHLRGVAPTWNSNDSQGSNYAYTLPTIEEPDRAIQQLTNLARGHALSQGRISIALDDVPMIIKIVLSTASKERVTIFDLLLAYNGKLTASEISTSLNMSLPTARRIMLELWVLKLVDKDNPEDNTSAEQISLRPDFSWFITEEFRGLRNDNKGSQCGLSKTEELKEKIPLSSEDFLASDNPWPSADKVASFRKIYDEIADEQKKLRNCMEVDKTTVGGQEIKQRLVSSGFFTTSDAQMMIEEMVHQGELKVVSYDTYVRGSTKKEDDSTERKNPP